MRTAGVQAASTPDEEQSRLLQDISGQIKKHAFYLKKAMDEDNLREALRFSAAMLGELRTGLLTPQKYFELYMQAFNELCLLQSFFADESGTRRPYGELYEMVQHAGNVLPRLYLLCTVGACYIKSKEANAKDILKDLVEMCKGVQHPTRGLFLRSYLCQVSRGLLPDTGSEYEGAGGGTVLDALDFLLQNFTEMNKLWVRMQHQGSVRGRERQEGERQQLADLVGKNLTAVSQLDGLTFDLYCDTVLPRVMEQIISCKDAIAQQYLMQALIQGFPDEFHLGTLEVLLGACPELAPGVKVHLIMASLMDRLARYAADDATVKQQFTNVDAFGKLKRAASRVAEGFTEMLAADIAALYIALIRFTAAVYPQHLDMVDEVLASCQEALGSRNLATDARAEKALVSLLSIPLESYDVVTVLGLSRYPGLMALLHLSTRKQMATKIVHCILKNDTKVTSVEKANMLFDFIEPLVKDVAGIDEDMDDEDFEEEQSQVAKLLLQLRGDSPAAHFAVLACARERLSQGGPARLSHTLPPLGFAAQRLVRELVAARMSGSAEQLAVQEVLHFTRAVAEQLAEVPTRAEVALQMFLTGALAASEEARLEVFAYEFMEQAFILYEEAIPDSRSEVTALQSCVGVLHRCRVFGPENRGALAHKATGFSAKLLKRADQCRAVLACSHIHWQAEDSSAIEEGGAEEPQPSDSEASACLAAGRGNDEAEEGTQRYPPVRDAGAVMACLKRALKMANAAQQQLAMSARRSGLSEPVSLFVDILSQYLYYFEQGLPDITLQVLQSMLDLVANEMRSEACQQDGTLCRYYANTLAHIRRCGSGGGSSGSGGLRYAELQL